MGFLDLLIKNCNKWGSLIYNSIKLDHKYKWD